MPLGHSCHQLQGSTDMEKSKKKRTSFMHFSTNTQLLLWELFSFAEPRFQHLKWENTTCTCHISWKNHGGVFYTVKLGSRDTWNKALEQSLWIKWLEFGTVTYYQCLKELFLRVMFTQQLPMNSSGLNTWLLDMKNTDFLEQPAELSIKKEK